MFIFILQKFQIFTNFKIIYARYCVLVLGDVCKSNEKALMVYRIELVLWVGTDRNNPVRHLRQTIELDLMSGDRINDPLPVKHKHKINIVFI